MIKCHLLQINASRYNPPTIRILLGTTQKKSQEWRNASMCHDSHPLPLDYKVPLLVINVVYLKNPMSKVNFENVLLIFD